MYSKANGSMAVVVVVLKETILLNYGPTYITPVGRPHIGCQVFDGTIVSDCPLCQDLSGCRGGERVGRKLARQRSHGESRGKMKLRPLATGQGLAHCACIKTFLRSRPGRFFGIVIAKASRGDWLEGWRMVGRVA